MTKKLKKITALALTIVLMLPLSVFALKNNSPGYDYHNAVNFLKRLNITPPDYDIVGDATRMDCLWMLTMIRTGNDVDTSVPPSIYFDEEIGQKYADADKLNNAEKCIVERADSIGLLHGVNVDGKLYIHPQKPLTWREALIFTLRLTCPEFEYYYPGDDGLLFAAPYRGYVEFDNASELDIVIKKDELCLLLNKALHEPVIINGWTRFTEYYIDAYIK